jgi:chaperone modulatory protein CbpM
MTDELILLLDDARRISLAELVAASGYSAAELCELVTLGALAAEGLEPEWQFSAQCIEIARTARRLQIDFEIGLPAVALVLAYHERVRELELQLQALACRLPGSAAGGQP